MHVRELSYKLEVSADLYVGLIPKYAESTEASISHIAYHTAHRQYDQNTDLSQVRTFCGLVGHYRRFIKGFANIACPLYEVLGKEVKMGPVDLPPKPGRP